MSHLRDRGADNPSFLSATPVVVALMLAWFALIVVQGWTRSGWLDEFFTAAVTDPHVSWREHLSSWRAEPHPPTYSGLLWTYRTFIDEKSIFALRFFSIGLSVLLACGALAYWKASRWPGLALFTFFMCTSPVLEFYPQETRSYFLAAFGGLYASLFLLRAFESETPDKPKARDVILGVAAAALLSTHLISFLFAGLLFGIACAFMIVEKRWAWLKTTLLIGLLIMGPALALISATIFGTITTAVKTFWITRWEVIVTAAALPIATGAPIVLTLAYACWRRRDIKSRALKTAAGLALSIICSVLILGLVSIIRPILVLRYLAAPMAALAAPCAILAIGLAPWERLRSRRYATGLLASLAAGAFALGLFNGGLNPRSDWVTPATALNAAPACGTAAVAYLVLQHEPDPNLDWAHNFEWYAPGHRFVPATAANQNDISRQACSVRLWAAHTNPQKVAEGHLPSVTRACAGRPATALMFIDGYLIVDNEDQKTIAAWPGRKAACDDMLKPM